MPATLQDSVWAAASLTIMSVCLLLPALFNGFPLIFPDSAVYVHQALTFEVEGPRAMGYALFLRPMAELGTLWPAIVIQAILTAWAMQTLFDKLFPWGSRSFKSSLPLLAFTSPLPWSVCFVMPDIFVGLLIVAVAGTICSDLRGHPARNWPFILLGGVASVMHSSSIILLGLLTLLALSASGLPPVQRAIGRAVIKRSRGSLLLTLGLGLVLNMLINVTTHHRLTPLAPYGMGVALAAFNQNGLVKEYLHENCDRHPYKICSFSSALPSDPAQFLFDANSPFNKLGHFRGMDREATEIVVGIALSRPVSVLRHLFQSALVQLPLFDVREDLVSASANPGVLTLLEQHHIRALSQYKNAPQHSGSFPPALQVSLQWWATVASIGLVLIIFATSAYRICGYQIAVVSFIVAGIGFNALISGGLSVPQSRYETRTIWLMQFLAVGLAATATARTASAKR